jgi:hypothetical protein
MMFATCKQRHAMPADCCTDEHRADGAFFREGGNTRKGQLSEMRRRMYLPAAALILLTFELSNAVQPLATSSRPASLLPLVITSIHARITNKHDLTLVDAIMTDDRSLGHCGESSCDVMTFRET